MKLVETGPAGAERLALARMAVGAVAFVAPRAFGRAWIGSDAGSTNVALITRACAVRDFALGLGVFLSVRKHAPVRGWLEAGVLCDLADAASALRTPTSAVRKALFVGPALVGVAGGILAMSGPSS
jgi:hypothetical protein